MSALSRGRTEIAGLPDSDDIRIMLGNLPSLGVQMEKSPVGSVIITGCGGPFPVKKIHLNLENAGTALRPLVAVLCAGSGSFTIDGNDQMRKRPIRDLVQSLGEIGIRISAENGCPPVKIETEGMPGGLVKISGAVSSQFLSALLIASPLAKSEIKIILTDDPVSKPYIDLTLHMMKDFGINVIRNGYKEFFIIPGTYISPGKYLVEGDASAATYFLAAASIPGSGPVTVNGISKNSCQGDIHFTDILVRMGASVEFSENSITAFGSSDEKRLRGIDVDMNDMPDAAMTLAVLCMFADRECHIRNIANLRVKESERISGIRKELEKLGAVVKEEHDALHIIPPEKIQFAKIDTYKDHRMAMAFSLAALGSDVVINDPGCVSKTFPGYFKAFLPLLKH